MTSGNRVQHRWIAGGVVGAVLAAAVAWFALIGPARSTAASLAEQTAQAQQQNGTLQQKVNRLRAQNSNIGTLTQALRVARTALPLDSGLPDFTRQVAAQATAAGVSLTSLAAGTPATADGSASAGLASAAGHLFAIPMTLVGDGSARADQALIRALQSGDRTVLVTSAQLAAGGDPSAPTGLTNMTVQFTVFVSPQTPAAEAALRKQLAAG
jgi:hypothetical protein